MAGTSLEDTFKTEKWLLHVDGSSTIQGSGAGIVITSPQGEDLEFTVKFGLKASNNETEYEALVIGYFWPTMKQDAKQLVIKCERCQKHSSLIHQPAEPITTMLSPCPFAQWGMDIVGPFPLAPGQRKFLLVPIDYFTKWVEAEPLARITEREVMKFI
ncbi:UNVERIFIED_CONTAM: hypothetical protein Slati_1524600 [Sesamum latifolium]|uniref:Integrase catalytic domain-containing protein n=1 Tax=Sesamum latifolium TaxID=2727402 RepID=A0AAW2X683_9LAMI